jgi:hypothetical protein
MTALALALLLASDPAPTLAPPATEGTEVVLHDVATVTGRDRLRELTASLSTGSWDGVAEQAGVQLDGLAEARTVMLAREQHLVDALRELVPVTEDPGYRVEALGD